MEFSNFFRVLHVLSFLNDEESGTGYPFSDRRILSRRHFLWVWVDYSKVKVQERQKAGAAEVKPYGGQEKKRKLRLCIPN